MVCSIIDIVDIPDELSIPEGLCGKVEPRLTHIGLLMMIMVYYACVFLYYISITSYLVIPIIYSHYPLHESSCYRYFCY